MKAKLTGLILFFSIITFSVQALDKKITTSDGTELFVTIKGEGIPCLYIHGGPGSGAYWLEAFSGEMLEKNMQMIYLDQRGVSRSGSAPDGNYSLDRMLLDFEDVREALKIKKWLVLGHSFGAGIQTAYAAKYPNAVAGLMMINGTVNVSASLDEMVKQAKSKASKEAVAGLDDPSKTLMERMMICHQALGENVWKMYYRDKASADTMNAVMGRVSNWNHDFSSKAANFNEYFADFTPLTKKVKVPVLVFSGNNDLAIGPEHYKLIQFPKQVLVKADCGHLPFIEAKQELQSAITQYLNKFFPSKRV